MHYLIEKLFEKRGIESSDQLRQDEKDDFDRWQAILSEGEVTLETIQKFCEGQIVLIESQWKNLDNTKEKNERLILLHNVYKSILGTIFNDKRAEKEALEKYLNSLL